MTDFISGKAAIAMGKTRRCLLKWELTKTLRIMKLGAFLLLAAAMHVSAKGVTQDRITLSLKNAPLEKVFDAIESQSGFVFIYKNETVKDKKVSIQVTNASLPAVLEECLKGQDLSYRIVGKSVAIKTVHKGAEITGNELANAPPLIDVKGKVLNEKGDPVEGVTVRVKGTEKFTLTDKNGEFSLVTVERDAVLSFTHITMESFELKVSGQTELLIKLRTKVSSLGEVVVSVNTGYQQVSKERFVGSVSTLDSAAFARRAGMDIISRLDGTVPGVLFDKKGGLGQLQSVQIRGLSTLTGLTQSASNEPLIIVDNFPFRQQLSTLNPNDIESITVLKDAAAASIWGAQAGNGVIVITTKKGKYNQPLNVTVSSNITFKNKPDVYYYPQITVPDFVDAEIALFKKGAFDADLNNTSSWPVISPVVELLAKRRAGIISAADSASQIDAMKGMDLRRDLNKYVYRTAISQQHYIQLSGGNSQFNYSFSGGYNRDLNNTQHSKPDDQFTLNTRVGFRPVRNLEITSGVNYSQGTQQSNAITIPSKMYPYAQLADAEGNALAVPNRYRVTYLDTVGAGKLLNWKYKPLEEIGLTDRTDVTRLIQWNTTIAYRITSWLNATASYQYNAQLFTGNLFDSPESYAARDLINQFTNLSQSNPGLRNPVPLGGIKYITNNEIKSQNARGQLNFSKTFNVKHQVIALLASEVSETVNSSYSNNFYGYDNTNGSYTSTIDYLNIYPLYGGIANRQIPNANVINPMLKLRLVSFLGNVSYTYDGRYTIYGSARKDGSNAFGVNTNRKWKPLWSAGVSWNVTQEDFFHVSWVSSLRLRASYGLTGNPGNATGLPTIKYNTGTANYTNLTYAYIGDAPNPDLKWEKVSTLNAGIDFSLFKSRLSGSIEVYQKKSGDIISLRPFAPSTGVTTFITNTANLKGNGFDISLVSKNIVGAFSWQTSFNLSHAKTVVTKLFTLNAYNAQSFVSYGLNAMEGQIVYGLASYRWAGLDPQTGDPRGFYGKQASTNYSAIANDSIGNQVFHGSSIPLYFGNLSNSFSWKNFTLSANISYRLNFYYRKPVLSYSNLVNNWSGHADYASRWQKSGDEKYTNVPSFTYPLDITRDQFYQYAEINVLRGDNIRLQDLRLQYNWNKKSLKKIPFNNVQVFAYANNLNFILWRKSPSDLDPDFVGGSNFTSPTPKTWALGLSANF